MWSTGVEGIRDRGPVLQIFVYTRGLDLLWVVCFSLCEWLKHSNALSLLAEQTCSKTNKAFNVGPHLEVTNSLSSSEDIHLPVAGSLGQSYQRERWKGRKGDADHIPMPSSFSCPQPRCSQNASRDGKPISNERCGNSQGSSERSKEQHRDEQQ